MADVSLKDVFSGWAKYTKDVRFIWDRVCLSPDSELASSQAKFLQFIGSRKLKETDGHFGIGNLFFNLDIIAHGKYPWGIVGDINMAQVELMNTLVECLKCKGMHTTAQEFYALFKQKMPQNKITLEDLDDEFSRAGSWLCQPDLFRHVVKLANQGNLIGVPVDLFSAAQCRKMASLTGEAGLTFGTVNLSNLTGMLKDNEDFWKGNITASDIQQFWKNIAEFCNRSTIICDACYRNSNAEPKKHGTALGDYVFSHGSLEERRREHLARRKAWAQGNADAFWDRFHPGVQKGPGK